MKEGFLGSAAPLAADLVLLLEIAMGVGLVIGGHLARIGVFGFTPSANPESCFSTSR